MASSTLSREDLIRRNPFLAPGRPRRWGTVPSGYRPLRQDETIARGDIMRVAEGWFEEYTGYSLLGQAPGPQLRLFPPSWYRRD